MVARCHACINFCCLISDCPCAACVRTHLEWHAVPRCAPQVLCSIANYINLHRRKRTACCHELLAALCPRLVAVERTFMYARGACSELLTLGVLLPNHTISSITTARQCTRSSGSRGQGQGQGCSPQPPHNAPAMLASPTRRHAGRRGLPWSPWAHAPSGGRAAAAASASRLVPHGSPAVPSPRSTLARMQPTTQHTRARLCCPQHVELAARRGDWHRPGHHELMRGRHGGQGEPVCALCEELLLRSPLPPSHACMQGSWWCCVCVWVQQPLVGLGCPQAPSNSHARTRPLASLRSCPR